MLSCRTTYIYKLIKFSTLFQVVFAALLAVSAAAPGFYGGAYAAPVAAPWGHGLVGAPLVSAPVVKAAVPVATSYANTVRVCSINYPSAPKGVKPFRGPEGKYKYK